MPVLEGANEIADAWVDVPDDVVLPDSGAVIVSLKRFLSEGHNARLGVRIGATTTPDELAQVAARAAMVEIVFPGSRDGRGFSLARRLRERHGFAGEIRASGHVLPDHHAMLRRCGFTTVVVPEGRDLAPWRAMLTRFATAYQVSVATV